MLDRFQAGDSLLHRRDPRLKVVVVVLFILSMALLPDGAWLAFALAFGLVLATSLASGLGAGYALSRSFVALPFALAAVTVIFTLPGASVATWTVGPWTLTATAPGLIRFGSIVVRSLLSVQMAILLAATTPFPDLLHALGHLRVPSVLVAIVAFMYRYLFVLTDEVQRLLRARAARSARPAGGGGGGSLRWRAHVTGSMAGQLFVRGYDRSERVYQAMLARGYDGQPRTSRAHALRRPDWLLGAAAGLALLLIQVVGRWPAR